MAEKHGKEESETKEKAKHPLDGVDGIPFYPVTKRDWRKVGGKWLLESEKRDVVTAAQTKLILAEEGLPFESRHRRLRKNLDHSRPFDTFVSWSPNGERKSEWQVDFAAGFAARRKYVDEALRGKGE